MFAIIRDNVILQLIEPGTSFTLDDLQYPQNWCNLSTPEEKAAIGMVDVIKSPRPDDRFYVVSERVTVANGVAVMQYDAQPKDLVPLKLGAVRALTAAVYSLLAPSDWMVVKAFETNTAIAQNWSAWRAQIRALTNAQRLQIDACASVEQLAALEAVAWPADPDTVSA